MRRCYRRHPLIAVFAYGKYRLPAGRGLAISMVIYEWKG